MRLAVNGSEGFKFAARHSAELCGRASPAPICGLDELSGPVAHEASAAQSARSAIDLMFSVSVEDKWKAIQRPNVELTGRRRQGARPGTQTMYRVPAARAWRPAVGAPVER
jgi:hypothetical protein